MLFDLRGKRKRAVQVVYATLALLMGGGLVLFGIGSDVQGGLFDAFGDRNSGGQVQFDDEAADIEQKLRRDPKDERLLLALTRARYNAGNVQIVTDPNTGQQTIPPEAREEFAKAADAWDRYVKTKPQKPSPAVAQIAANTLFTLAQSATTSSEADAAIADAADAQAIVAKARPSVGSLSTLAQFKYFALDFPAADKAAKQAAAAAPSTERKLTAQRLADIRKQAKQFEKQLAAAEKAQKGQGKQALENPLGGLSGGGVGGTQPAP